MDGMGVMLNKLGGNKETYENWKEMEGQIITEVFLKDNELHFAFDNGSRYYMWDDGQSCCETRYMNTDDNLDYYFGSKLLDAEILDAQEATHSYEVHEIQFLKITTSKGVFTVANHNEHNGYYGGFAIVITKAKGAEKEN